MRRLVAALAVASIAGCSGTTRHGLEAPAAPPAPSGRTDAAKTQPEAFTHAYRLIRKGKHQEARPLLEELVDRYAALEDYALHYLALTSARCGAPAQALSLWTRLINDHPRSLLRAQASLQRARLQRAAGNLDAARVDLEAARRSDRAAVAHAALLDLAEIDAAAGNAAAAHAELMALRHAAAGTQLGREVKRRIVDLRRRDPTLAPQGVALEEELRLLIAERDHVAAIRTADELLSSAAPQDRPDLLRLRADAELGMGRFEESVASLGEIVQRFPQSAAAPDALFRAASLLWNRDREGEAKRRFLELRRRYPRSARAAEALYAIARIAEADGDTTAALAAYARLANGYPRSALARDGRWRIGWVQYQTRNWRRAVAAFNQVARQTRAGDAADALYWKARALDHAGDGAAARHTYRRVLRAAPTSYYADWAERRLGVRPSAPLPIAAPPADGLGEPPPSTPDRYHFVRARELHAAGLPLLALAELHAFEEANPNQPELVRYLISAYTVAGGYRDAIRLDRARGRAGPAVLYPLAFWPAITRLTAGTGLDPLLVLALIRQESFFDPTARSRANARGLMQLLPRTAEAEARRLGRAFSVQELYDPDINLTLGIAHFRRLLERHQGSSLKALAAYNAGEDALAKWEARFGRLDLDEFVENITYRETRDYVKKVIGHYQAYRRRYAAAAKPA